MRISDDRYTRDRERLDLALRFIRHEARTFTIRQWTGLSDDRIRKLYRSYVLHNEAGHVLRHRGKSPRQAAFFFRNPEVNFHAAQLASLFLMYGLVGSTGNCVEPRYRVGSLESGALLCRAYEAYLDLHTPASISFEHAWFLLLALARRDEVGVARCVSCGGVRLRDLLARHRHSCGNCHPAATLTQLSQLDTCCLGASRHAPAGDSVERGLANRARLDHDTNSAPYMHQGRWQSGPQHAGEKVSPREAENDDAEHEQSHGREENVVGSHPARCGYCRRHRFYRRSHDQAPVFIGDPSSRRFHPAADSCAR